MRITKKILENKARNLNILTNNPLEPITDNKEWQVNSYFIDKGYGGYALRQINNKDGGTYDVFNIGVVSAQELAHLIDAYSMGIREGRNDNGKG